MRVKNRSDLEEFPDGGHATRVRRYSPTMTRRQLAVLACAPYENPRLIGPGSSLRGAALLLVRSGLLERHPDDRDLFRCTGAGTEVLQKWKSAGLLPDYP